MEGVQPAGPVQPWRRSPEGRPHAHQAPLSPSRASARRTEGTEVLQEGASRGPQAPQTPRPHQLSGAPAPRVEDAACGASKEGLWLEGRVCLT